MNVVNYTKQDQEQIISAFVKRFKNIKRILILLIVLLIISLFITVIWLGVEGTNRLKVHTIGIALALGIAGIKLSLDKRFLKDFTAIYNEGCNPILALAIVDRIKSYRTVFKSYKITFLLALGRNEEAKQILDTLMLRSKDNVKITVFEHELLQFLYHDAKKDIESALEILEKLEKLVDETKIEKHASLGYIISTMRASIAVLQADYPQAKQLYLHLLETRTEMITKVSCHYHLGYIAIQLNNLKEAKERLQYVITNGNTLNQVKLAKQLMEAHKLFD